MIMIKIMYAKPSDEGTVIPIAIHPKLEEILEIGNNHFLQIMFAGGTAREMVLRKNPLTPTTDLDIMISCLDKPDQPTWEQALLLTKDLRKVVNIKVDIMNFEGHRWYPPYTKFKLSNALSINRLLISKDIKNSDWYITDFKGGVYLQTIREKKLQFVETNPKLFHCDLRDALLFIRHILEFPELEIEPLSMKLMKSFINNGHTDFLGQQIPFIEFVDKFFHLQKDIIPGKLVLPRQPFQALFSIFLYAEDIETVLPFLEQMRLREVFEQFVDLEETKKIAIEKRLNNHPIAYIEFDSTFRRLQNLLTPINQHWSQLFHKREDCKTFFATELKERFNANKPLLIQYVKQFTEDFICKFIPIFNQALLVNRITVIHNILKIFQKVLLSSYLNEEWYLYIAVFLPENISEFIHQNEFYIREKVNSGQYLNFLDYFYQHGGVNILKQKLK